MEGTIVEIRDKHGEGFDVLEYEDLVMPVLFQRMGPSTRLNAIKEFKHQEGDVLICSYPKSGYIGFEMLLPTLKMIAIKNSLLPGIIVKGHATVTTTEFQCSIVLNTARSGSDCRVISVLIDEMHTRLIFGLEGLPTGTHWVYNLVHFLMYPGPVESMPILNPRQLELSSLSDIEMLPAPRLISSHLKPNRLPTEHMQKNGKIVLLARNPKDTMVSCLYHIQRNEYFNYSKLSWKQFFECWASGKIPVGSFFDYFNSWQQEITNNHDINVLVVYYEDIIKDGVNQLKRLQHFLGTENSDARLQQILDRCTMSNLKFKKEEQKAEPMLQDEYAKQILYRKGDVGNWRNHFTVAQNEYFDKLLEDNFKESMFKFQYD